MYIFLVARLAIFTRVAWSMSSESHGGISSAGSFFQLAQVGVGVSIRATHGLLILTHTLRLRVLPGLAPPPSLCFPLADQPLSTAPIELLSPIRVTLLALHVATLLTAAAAVPNSPSWAVMERQRTALWITLPTALTLLPET